MIKQIFTKVIHHLARHSLLMLIAACCTFSVFHAPRTSPKVPLYNRVMQQENNFSMLQGDIVTLNGISMFVPNDWQDVSACHPYARHPALIAVYQACDLLGRQITLIITRQENTGQWLPAETGELYFTTWFAGEGRTLYRIDVQAANARSASSSRLCQALRCMLSSMTLTTHTHY